MKFLFCSSHPLESFYACPKFALDDKLDLASEITTAIQAELSHNIGGKQTSVSRTTIGVDIPLFNSIFLGNVDVHTSMKPILAFESDFPEALFPRSSDLHSWDRVFGTYDFSFCVLRAKYFHVSH